MATNNTPSLSQLKRAVQIQEQIEALQAQLASVLGGQSSTATTTSGYTGAKRGRKPGVKASVDTGESAEGGGEIGNGKKAGKKAKTKRTMSPEAREKIAAAQRKRWAKSKKAK